MGQVAVLEAEAVGVPTVWRPGLASRETEDGTCGVGQTSDQAIIFLPLAVTRAASLVPPPSLIPRLSSSPCEPKLMIHTYIHNRPFVFKMLLPIMMSVPACVGKGAQHAQMARDL